MRECDRYSRLTRIEAGKYQRLYDNWRLKKIKVVTVGPKIVRYFRLITC